MKKKCNDAQNPEFRKMKLKFLRGCALCNQSEKLFEIRCALNQDISNQVRTKLGYFNKSTTTKL